MSWLGHRREVVSVVEDPRVARRRWPVGPLLLGAPCRKLWGGGYREILRYIFRYRDISRFPGVGRTMGQEEERNEAAHLPSSEAPPPMATGWAKGQSEEGRLAGSPAPPGERRRVGGRKLRLARTRAPPGDQAARMEDGGWDRKDQGRKMWAER